MVMCAEFAGKSASECTRGQACRCIKECSVCLDSRVVDGFECQHCKLDVSEKQDKKDEI